MIHPEAALACDISNYWSQPRQKFGKLRGNFGANLREFIFGHSEINICQDACDYIRHFRPYKILIVPSQVLIIRRGFLYYLHWPLGTARLKCRPSLLTQVRGIKRITAASGMERLKI